MFDADDNGLLSPAEVFGALRWLGVPGVTADDVTLLHLNYHHDTTNLYNPHLFLHPYAKVPTVSVLILTATMDVVLIGFLAADGHLSLMFIVSPRNGSKDGQRMTGLEG